MTDRLKGQDFDSGYWLEEAERIVEAAHAPRVIKCGCIVTAHGDIVHPCGQHKVATEGRKG